MAFSAWGFQIYTGSCAGSLDLPHARTHKYLCYWWRLLWLAKFGRLVVNSEPMLDTRGKKGFTHASFVGLVHRPRRCRTWTLKSPNMDIWIHLWWRWGKIGTSSWLAHLSKCDIQELLIAKKGGLCGVVDFSLLSGLITPWWYTHAIVDRYSDGSQSIVDEF